MNFVQSEKIELSMTEAAKLNAVMCMCEGIQNCARSPKNRAIAKTCLLALTELKKGIEVKD